MKTKYKVNPKLVNRKNLHSLSSGKNKENPTKKELRKYTVWVGGTEITDFFVTYSIAKELLKQYQALDYDDVIIQEGR